MSIDMAQFHQVFFEESFEGLDLMEKGLLELDPGTLDDEEINAIFRAAHSIKGGAGTFGFTPIADFTHLMETLLDEMRDGRRPVTSEAVEVLLRSVDVLREMMVATRDESALDIDRIAAQQEELQRTLDQTPTAAAPDPGGVPAPAEVPADRQTQHAEPEVVGWHIVFRPHPHLLRTANDPLRLLEELDALGELQVECDLDALPNPKDFDPEEAYLSWDLHLRAPVQRFQIEEIFDWVEEDCDLAIMPIHGVTPASGEAEDRETSTPAPAPVPQATPAVPQTSKPKAKARPKSKDSGSSSIRVDIAKIDALINMVGELVITQSMLGMLGEEFEEILEPSHLERLHEGLTQLERNTRELQENVMQIRMLPISFTFSRFPRLVHDLSTKLGKKVELRLVGESTEVDKTVIEKIGDPLVHLVRNSLDHGLEPPEERLAAGKPDTGILELNAYHKGGNIVIEIRDDGRGLNRDRILAKAQEKGLVGEDHNLSDQQIYELIFQPGFSTAEQVSDVSGRGVGMDVVRKNITELGGNIEIESTPGQGSAIIIRLPLTLAILDGQTVAVGDETYIVPLVSIIESIQIRPNMINLLAGRGETFKLRDEYLPIIRLHEIFGITNPRATDLEQGLLVVLEGEGRRCGLFVDDLLGQQQVVIKSLEANYKRVEGISGATILGDGSVALILDIPGLMRLAARQATPEPLALTA